MLADKLILYDDSCPMCSLYTQAFVNCRMLSPENRIGFSHAKPEIIGRLDVDRARHEIPLLDVKTGEVSYGIDALLLIFSHHFPPLNILFRFKLFRAPLYALYQIITYNRRVIAGTAAPCQGFNCAPDFNLKYRSLYLTLALSAWLMLMTGLVNISRLSGDPALVGLLVTILILQIAALAAGLRKRRRWDYASNVATNLLMFGLISVPLLKSTLHGALAGAIVTIASVIAAIDYGRRVRNLALPELGIR